MKKIYICSDHKGYEQKRTIVEHLRKNGYEVHDFGTDSAEPVDYPDYAHMVGKAVASDGDSKAAGIVICDSGHGVAISADKVPGIRAGLCYDETMAVHVRKHNNCNVIALGAAYTGVPRILNMIDIFLATEFEGGRHERRVNKIEITDIVTESKE